MDPAWQFRRQASFTVTPETTLLNVIAQRGEMIACSPQIGVHIEGTVKAVHNLAEVPEGRGLVGPSRESHNSDKPCVQWRTPDNNNVNIIVLMVEKVWDRVWIR